LEKETQAQRDDGKALSKQQKLAERYLAKRQMFSARKEVCSRSIRDLGVLPEEAFEKYTKDKSEKVTASLPSPKMACPFFVDQTISFTPPHSSSRNSPPSTRT
jgi:chromatin segregation and condensation protein Rec8/ScpA/Scc1 (kleisin family)